MQLNEFIENYEFPIVGLCDGFHVYVSSKLKPYFSFKKRYIMSNIPIVGYNKRFSDSAVEAPGNWPLAMSFCISLIIPY